ncbi:adenylate/guanylate cyclase [Leptospira ryugenii]|uniref:Adenylate/guanylate cyclase n=1 Tax=Leptospira ryugenii TaxID=1917863 RepID=A0A2P2E0L7_9LEPT|nr:adenylate/guanylate cyclase domain-containing protein [Leptospira ryugenii]GBF50424.1 adenylate/guanylate cyclase [Leptospira ryugenii]
MMRIIVLLFLFALGSQCSTETRENSLNGAWEFIYLPVSESFPSKDDLKWKAFEPGENLYTPNSRVGILWYRTTFNILPGYKLMIPPASVPGLYRVYVDGVMVHSFASLSEGKADVRKVWPIIDLPPPNKNNPQHSNLLISAHNTDDYGERGIMGPIWIGPADSIQTRFLLSQADTLFLGLVFLALSLATFAVSIGFSRDWGTFNFGFFLASLGSLSVLRSDLAWYLSGLGDEWFTLLRLSFFSVPIGLFGIALPMFRGKSRRILFALYSLLGSFFFLSFANEFTLTLNVWFVFRIFLLIIIPGALTLGALSIIAAIHGNRELRLFSIGLSLFLFAALIDLVDRFLELIPFGLIHWALIAFVGIVLFLITDRFFQSQRDLRAYTDNLEKTNRSLRRFVPDQFLDILGKPSLVEVNHGDQVQREMTVLFADIRSFTELSESMTPQENFNFLNSYLQRVGPIIRENGGFIDKYIGDAIMALFDSSEDAVRAAIQMHAMVRSHNQVRIDTNRVPIKIGIGIHRGMVMLGTIGEVERIDNTVIGDAVNIASRLEGLTSGYGAGVLLSSDVVHELNGDYKLRTLGKHLVKGKRLPVLVFELLDVDTPDISEKKLEYDPFFQEAIKHFAKGQFKLAQKTLSSLVQSNPYDGAAQRILERCKRMLRVK